ncbi:MAG: glycosyltransferase family 4 protein [Bacteroidota bacterium]
MIKIVLITPILQPYRITFYEKLAVINKEYELKVFHGSTTKEDGKTRYEGVTEFESIGFVEHKYKILPFEVIINQGMYSKIKEVNPDILIMLASTGNITLWKIISWAKSNNKKVIIWTSGWEPGRAKGILLTLKNRLVSSFYKKADFFLTYSTYASQYVESMGVDKSKIEICYNGIETDDLVKNSDEIIKTSKDIIKKYNLADHITFLYVGGLIHEKRIDLLIESFTQLRKKYFNIKLIIIGDGPLKEMVKERLKTINDSNIFYLGRIIDGVDPFFVASDCLVLSGAGGLALNQAMFWRKPCIVSKADGTEDDLVIENFSGYRFMENDQDSLTSAMEKRILDDNEKVTQLGENAYQLIINKSNVTNMVEVFSKAVNSLFKRS